MIAWEMRRVLSVLLPSRRAQPCQYEDVRREQDGRLADLRGADPRGARGSPTRIWIDKPALSKALPSPTASRTKKRGAQKRRQARYKLSLRRILTCVFTWTGGAPACSFRTLASSLMAAR